MRSAVTTGPAAANLGSIGMACSVRAASGSPPVNTVAPVVTSDGTLASPVAGDTLSTTDGTWTNSPTSFDYSWRWEDNTEIATGANSYTILTSDAGHLIHCHVTAHNGSGTGGSDSNASGVVAPVAWVTAAGSFSLTTDVDRWVGCQFTVIDEYIEVTALGRMFFTGNSLHHTVGVFDVGGNLLVSASVDCSTGTNHQFNYTPSVYRIYAGDYFLASLEGGTDSYNNSTAPTVLPDATVVYSAHRDGTGTSGAFTTDAAGECYVPPNIKFMQADTPPFNARLPLIDNPLPQVGETVYADAGLWTQGPTLAYQWLADGVAIGGATSLSFVVTLTQLGKALTFQSTANGTVSAMSAATSAVAANGSGPAVLKLYADNISGVVTDPVATWPDKSGNGNNATQGTPANQPVLAAGPNGKMAVLFDGAGDSLVSNVTLTQPYTVVIVCQSVVPSGGYFINGDSANNGVISAYSPTQFFAYAGSFLFALGTPTNWNEIAALFNGASSYIDINGTQTTGAVGTSNATSLILGNGNVGISALLILSGDMSAYLSHFAEYMNAYYGV